MAAWSDSKKPSEVGIMISYMVVKLRHHVFCLLKQMNKMILKLGTA